MSPRHLLVSKIWAAVLTVIAHDVTGCESRYLVQICSSLNMQFCGGQVSDGGFSVFEELACRNTAQASWTCHFHRS